MVEVKLTVSEWFQLVKELTQSTFFVYMAMERLSDAKGVCSLTQAEIAEYVGITPRSLRVHFNKLSSQKVKGKRLIKVYKGHANRYEVIKLIADPVEKVKSDTPITSTVSSHPLAAGRGVMDYWKSKYMQTFDEPYYVANYAKEYTYIKRIAKETDPETFQAVIDAVFRLWDAKWRDKHFDRPTLGMLCSWLFRQALPFAMAAMPDKSVEIDTADIVAEDGLDILAQYDLARGFDSDGSTHS